MKKKMYSELAYVIGLVTLAFATAFMEKANFGMSMVVAPAYILHLKLSESFSFFTFGMAEYCLQAVLIVLLTLILRKFKLGYLFSFITAVLYGFTLDFWMWAIRGIPADTIPLRIVWFLIGMFVCAFGVAMFFNTYIAPEAYELIVKEISFEKNKKISVVKTIYDCISCTVAIIMSFVFFGFGHFVGVGIGTVITALLNGMIIGKISNWLNMKFEFVDKFRK